MNLSDYGALQYTQMLVGIVSPPSTMYIALAYEEPTPGGDASDLVEPVDATGYVRKSIATADWSLVSSDIPAVTNNNTYTWTASVDWEPVRFVVLCTSVGTDKVYAWTEVDPLAPLAGQSYILDAAAMVMSVSGPSEEVSV